MQRQLADELAARGVEGSLEFTHQHATLTVGGSARRAALNELPSRWRQLTPTQRRSALSPLAEQLASHHHRASGLWSSLAAAMAIALLAGGVGTTVVVQLLEERQAQQAESSEALRERERLARAERVCEATRSRVMRGGTAGAIDSEGWVVELALITRKRGADAGAERTLDEFLSSLGGGKYRLTWANASANLRAVTGATIELVERTEDELRELRFIVDQGYARSYFEETGRREWVQLSAALFDHLEAEYGALTARCAHQTSHHIGAWFGGRSAAGATSALLYYAGVFSETPVFIPEFLPPPDLGRAPLALARALESRANDVDRTQLAMWISEDRATVTGRDEGKIMLAFPYRDSNRASRSSLRVGRRLAIASDR